MKQVILNIPENKYELFIDFIKNIEFIKDYNELTNDVSNEEQEIILNRIKNTKKDDLKTWDEVSNTIILK
jgi:hypothetical protein